MSELITSDSTLMAGKPVIAGTRITVESILERLAGGESVKQVVSAHPNLSKEHVQAALEYAAESLGADIVHPLA